MKLGAFIINKSAELTDAELEVASKIFDNGYLQVDRNTFVTLNGRRLLGDKINSTDPISRIEFLESKGHMTKQQADKAVENTPSFVLGEFSIKCEE